MKVGTAFPSKYLKADDLEDRDWSMTIRQVVMEDIGQGEHKEPKMIIYFQELDKGLVCNKTNATVIEKLYGDETDAWKGKPVTLWPNHDVEFKGEIVSAIRVRSKAPKLSGPVPVSSGDKLGPWQNIVMDLLLEKVGGDMMLVEPLLKKYAGISNIGSLDDELASEVAMKIKNEAEAKK